MTSEPSGYFYPTITPDYLTPLRALRALILTTPDLLSRTECPYPVDVRKFLSELLVGGGREEITLLETPEDLERELSRAYQGLRDLEKQIATVDARDKVQWAKAVVGLLERIIDLRERTINLKQMSEFQRTVMGVLDEVLEPAQRTMFVERLGKYTKTPAKVS